MKTLIVLLGPTGVGKTDLSIRLAQRLGASIVSADSRQLYQGIEIGTAAPTAQQLAAVPHYFIGTHTLEQTYSAGQYELDALQVIDKLFAQSNYVVLTGGSMMYIDAVCNGMDDIPTVSDEVRAKVHHIYQTQGLATLQEMLKELDPNHYNKVDLCNYRRVMHAVEVCLEIGKPYSTLLSHTKKERPFRIVKIGLNRPRPELYERINQRVDIMIADGLEEEARRVYPYKHNNSLNTVGFKEWFDFWDGKTESKERVVELIKQNSRHYAKRQLTWFNRDTTITWFHPADEATITAFIGNLPE
ncbi:MAG: tRNA (adenosine(37)-N6)-dimethylallyltransferase MiaA [Paludibacteraceae bacterium]|nr:tRNA (adenosine(37)-N6)-dimethylallyltransferase MiaA [Paludibacteraceae bacterium]